MYANATQLKIDVCVCALSVDSNKRALVIKGSFIPPHIYQWLTSLCVKTRVHKNKNVYEFRREHSKF